MSSSPLPQERSDVDLKDDKHLPLSNEGYGRREYWDERYREEETFDWFVGYSKVRELILRHVNVKDSVLNLGLELFLFLFRIVWFLFVSFVCLMVLVVFFV